MAVNTPSPGGQGLFYLQFYWLSEHTRVNTEPRPQLNTSTIF